MSKYISGVYSATYSSGGPPPTNPTLPTNNFVYSNQFIKGVIQLTPDSKTSLQGAYSANGIYIGMDIAGTTAGIKLLGTGSSIDFTAINTTYNGRISYDNSTNSMQFYTNSGASAAMTILNNGVINTGGLTSSTSNSTAFATPFTFTNTYTGANPWTAAFLAPNLTNSTAIMVGQSNTNRNAGQFAFQYVSSGSTSNAINIGFFGFGSLLNVSASGQVQVATTPYSGTPSSTGAYFNVGNTTFTDNATAVSGTATT